MELDIEPPNLYLWYGEFTEEVFAEFVSDNDQGFEDIQIAVECALISLMQ